MSDNDIFFTLMAIMTAWFAGGFIYLNHLINAEARIAKAKRDAKAARQALKDAVEWCSPPPRCCDPVETNLDA